MGGSTKKINESAGKMGGRTLKPAKKSPGESAGSWKVPHAPYAGKWVGNILPPRTKIHLTFIKTPPRIPAAVSLRGKSPLLDRSAFKKIQRVWKKITPGVPHDSTSAYSEAQKAREGARRDLEEIPQRKARADTRIRKSNFLPNAPLR